MKSSFLRVSLTREKVSETPRRFTPGVGQLLIRAFQKIFMKEIVTTHMKFAFRISGVIAILVLLTTVPMAVSADDRFEPNDKFDSATQINSTSYENLVLDRLESDYYALSVEQGTLVNASATFLSENEPTNAPRIAIYDEQGNRMTDSDRYETSPRSETGTIQTSWEADSDQTVYISVRGVRDGESATYQLSVGTQNDRFENNGNIEVAQTVDPGEYASLSLVDREADYYAISVDQGTLINASATFLSENEPDNAPRITIYDKQGNRMVDSDRYETTPLSETGTIQTSWEARSDQTAYISVRGARGGASTTYSLRITGPTNNDVPKELQGDVTSKQYSAVLGNSDTLSASNLANAINGWSANGQVNGVDIGASELSKLINYWADS